MIRLHPANHRHCEQRSRPRLLPGEASNIRSGNSIPFAPIVRSALFRYYCCSTLQNQHATARIGLLLCIPSLGNAPSGKRIQIYRWLHLRDALRVARTSQHSSKQERFPIWLTAPSKPLADKIFIVAFDTSLARAFPVYTASDVYFP